MRDSGTTNERTLKTPYHSPFQLNISLILLTELLPNEILLFQIFLLYKYLEKQIFSHRSFPEVGEKHKAQKKRKEKKVGEKTLRPPPQVTHASTPGPKLPRVKCLLPFWVEKRKFALQCNLEMAICAEISCLQKLSDRIHLIVISSHFSTLVPPPGPLQIQQITYTHQY